jgi:hypothetical protein
MEPGFITLGEVARRAEALGVACTRCDRVGRHQVVTLISRYGPQFSIPDLLRLLSQGCPMRESVSNHDECGIHCTDLPNLFRH